MMYTVEKIESIDASVFNQMYADDQERLSVNKYSQVIHKYFEQKLD